MSYLMRCQWFPRLSTGGLKPRYMRCIENGSAVAHQDEDDVMFSADASESWTSKQPRVLEPRRRDVMTVTPWLAPIVWEGTFNQEVIDRIYRNVNLKVGVTVFAVGKYIRFLHGFLETAEKHLLQGYQVHYYIFTDKPSNVPQVELAPGRALTVVQVTKYARWQEISLRRMEIIKHTIQDWLLQEVNFLYCLDVDMLFHHHWGAEVLGSLVAAIHPGYYKVHRSVFPYERRSTSTAYVPIDQGDFYYAGAMFGGYVKNVLRLTEACHAALLTDRLNAIEAAWQEESHLNRYLLHHKPTKVLSPEYLWDDTKQQPPELKVIRFSTVIKNNAKVRENA
ncbi:globoside alpha-1,3-N-acetylgalactosaminyltransferase 1-like isoform X2 [Polypterus senegalus]|nr:globoside alpha-1,3-N-acetylgalactosaminyltransferase 1-like isoform X2 [Polypterus senegalus]